MGIGLATDEGDKVRPLPVWASWLRRVGSYAAQCSGEDERHTVLVTVPGRPYAAALVLLGVVEALYEREPEVIVHWQSLKALPAGTWVRHLDRGRYYTCSRIEAVFVRGGVEYLQLSGGLARRWDKCVDVQPLPVGEEPFNQRLAPKEHGFLKAALPDVDPRAFCSGGAPLALAVTSKALLINELCETRLIAGEAAVAGLLQDLVRARAQSGSPYRCDVVSASDEELPARACQRMPVCILDGAPAALRWRHRIDAGTSVVLLDRTAASFESAVEALLADRARSLRDVPLDALGERPPGLEATAFTERR